MEESAAYGAYADDPATFQMNRHRPHGRYSFFEPLTRVPDIRFFPLIRTLRHCGLAHFMSEEIPARGRGTR